MLMKIGIEGPKTLKDEQLDMIIYRLVEENNRVVYYGEVWGGGDREGGKLRTGDAIIG